MIVNLWNSLIRRQVCPIPIHPRELLSSQYCKYFFSSVTQVSNSPSGSPQATGIDTIVSKAALTRKLQMKIATSFSYMPSRNPRISGGVYLGNVVHVSNIFVIIPVLWIRIILMRIRIWGSALGKKRIQIRIQIRIQLLVNDFCEFYFPCDIFPSLHFRILRDYYYILKIQ